MVGKCRSLQQELHDAHNTIRSLNEMLGEKKSEAGNDAHPGLEQSDWDHLEQDIENHQLRSKITQLEENLSEMEMARQDALMNAANHICDVEEKY